jgi:hypothetical protein
MIYHLESVMRNTSDDILDLLQFAGSLLGPLTLEQVAIFHTFWGLVFLYPTSRFKSKMLLVNSLMVSV